MSLLGLFAAPVGAMMAQSKAMEVIGMNVANMNTGGYKRSETNFYTMLANSYDHNQDIGGVRGVTRSLIDQQGQLLGSDSNLDVAINGNGFFVLNSEVDGSGSTFYGRDGMLGMELGDEITTVLNGNTVTTREGFLVDKNGYYVQGWPVNADQETFPTDEASLASIRIDPETFTSNGEATTTAEIGLNVPADAAVGYNESTFIKTFDADGNGHNFQLRWTNIVLGSHTQTLAPTWELPSVAAGPTDPISVTAYNNRGYEKEFNVSLTRTSANNWDMQLLEGSTALNIDTDASPTTLAISFDPVTGALTSTPTSVSIQGTGDYDEAFTFDFSGFTQPIAAPVASLVQSAMANDGTLATAQKNRYSLEVLENGTPLSIDAASGDSTPTVLTVVFDGSGKIDDNFVTSVNIASAGTGPTFTLDISDVTNYASGQLVEGHYDFNGRSNARLDHVSFNASGEIIGHFADATTRPIYKLPLATFTNPNSLDPVNGNVYKLSGQTSQPVIRVAGGQGAGQFVPNAREISNVDMADEFTAMILTQKAYNMGSTVFKSVDEMSQVARDLKR